MTTISNIPWSEKYRPASLQEMEQGGNLMEMFGKSIEQKQLSHYLFYGPPGTGKTSAAIVIGKAIFQEHYHERVFEYNASNDRGINVVREQIAKKAKKSVSPLRCQDGSIAPGFKIIILDEADSMTEEAQDALRIIIEQHSSVTRFCFICNYINKITSAIKSRCSEVFFKRLEPEHIKTKLRNIIEKEQMELGDDILETVIDVSNGDMRKAITALHNLKYLYDYKQLVHGSQSELRVNQLRAIPSILASVKPEEKEISVNDVYEIEAVISPQEASDILNRLLACRRVRHIDLLVKEIISKGKPVDVVMGQINEAVLMHDVLTDIQKGKIFAYSIQVFTRLKHSASEQIQLLDYLSCIHGINQGCEIYEPTQI
jgi:replication factor C subunit 2/4